MTRLGRTAAIALVAGASGAWAQGQEPDNGTDPTKLSRNIYSSYEFRDLGEFEAQTFVLRFGQPLGNGRSSLTFRLPVVTTDLFEDDSFGLGDVSLKFSHVPIVTRQYGVVLSAELSFDTADRPDQGAGTDVLKLTGIYARFLPNRAIFAPSLVHSFSLGDVDLGRSEVSITTLDLYYVPRLPQPYYLTLDPSLNVDWENDKEFAGLAVTLGRGFDLGLTGNESFFVKPQIGVGGERPFDWSIEAGFKIVGF